MSNRSEEQRCNNYPCCLPDGHKGPCSSSPVESPSSKHNLDALAIYGRMVLDESRESLGDLDGGWLQDKAIECGLLAEVTVTQPCSSDPDQCRCTAYGDFPQRCLRLTDAAKAVIVTESAT